MTYAIDSDVELVPRRGKVKRSEQRPPLPLAELEVGQSFCVPGAQLTTISAAICAYTNRFPEKTFAMRTLEQDPKLRVAGVRVWRTK